GRVADVRRLVQFAGLDGQLVARVLAERGDLGGRAGDLRDRLTFDHIHRGRKRHARIHTADAGCACDDFDPVAVFGEHTDVVVRLYERPAVDARRHFGVKDVG